MSPASPPRIRLFAMDVDGTLTDGTITYMEDGTEIKSFHSRDGLAIKMLARVGIMPAVVSGRSSKATARRAKELGVEEVFQGVGDKAAVVEEIRERLGFRAEEVAFMGDDLSDLAAMRAAGFSAAPADADVEVRAVATFVCPSDGGRGAARDAIESLLRAMGLWEKAVSSLGPKGGGK